MIAVYDEDSSVPGKKNISFYTSDDLKTWTLQSKLPGYFECPNLFELPVLSKDGRPTGARKWVIYAADAQYAVGQFDGKRFTPDHEGKRQVQYGAYYAAMIFTRMPAGRVASIGWAKINMPGMPFTQGFTLPTELTLRETDDGIRLFAAPVQELESLRGTRHEGKPQSLAAGVPVSLPVSGQLFDIRCTFRPGTAETVTLTFGGAQVTYHKSGTLNGMPMPLVDGKATIRVVVDRPMFEVCGNDGRVYQTMGRRDGGKDIATISVTATGGEAALEAFDVSEMRSIWKTK